MKLVPYNGKIGGYYKKTANYELLKEFAESGLKCAEVEDFTQQSATGCANSLRQTLKRYRMGTVQAVTRNGRVFLIKVE